MSIDRRMDKDMVHIHNGMFSSGQFSRSVVSHSFRPHESQHARPPCPSPTPGVHSDSRPESVMPSSHLILCHPPLLLPSIFPNIRVFSNESALCMKWPKYWSVSFSISPSNEYSGLISFRIDLVWSPCFPRDSQEPSPAPQFENINSNRKNNTVFLIKYTYVMVITFAYLELFT